MRARTLIFLGALVGLPLANGLAQGLFNIPLRINMGGPETVDSHGRAWLGDGPGPDNDISDPLNIRVDDASGTNTIKDFVGGGLQPDSVTALGFDPLSFEDLAIFNSIRWDVGGDGIDFRMEIPVPNGKYLLNLFFNEGCCPQRHFKIEIQGTVVDPDVSHAIGMLERRSYKDVAVSDNLLRIALLPCPDPECPGSLDTNAIINAIEVLSGEGCDHNGLDFNCSYDSGANQVTGTFTDNPNADAYTVLKNGQPFLSLPAGSIGFNDSSPNSGGPLVTYTLQAFDGADPFATCQCAVLALGSATCPGNLTCIPTGTKVDLAWDGGSGINLTGWTVERNGQVIANLPAGDRTFQDSPISRRNNYRVVPATDPGGICAAMSCAACVDLLFSIPLRINMGGPEVVDSKGRTWIGDRGGAGDALCIRPNDLGGTQTLNPVPGQWCPPQFGSIEKYGFDSNHPGDNEIFGTIRWDVGSVVTLGDEPNNFLIEFGIPNGTYLVNLYFNECCCPQRHATVEVQGQVADEDVSSADFDPNFVAGIPGRLSVSNVAVTNQTLAISLLPCTTCPGVGDVNAILSALEVLSNDCSDPDFHQCPSSLSCTVDNTGKATGTWDPPLCLDTTGYQVKKEGQVIQNLPGTATSFTDNFTGRVAEYEVQPLVGPGVDPCLPIRCSAVNTSVPFDIPLRLNMGGPTLVDSLGRKWLGDGAGPGDLLSIRTDDLGGTNTISNWNPFYVINNPDSLRALGLDPANPNDLGIFNTIRWDLADDDNDGQIGEAIDPDGGDHDFHLEIPIPNGTYDVSTYFTEGCCPFRHFQIVLEGNVVEPDVSAALYSTSGNLGRTARLTYPNTAVNDGALNIDLLPCPFDCLGATDSNAIIDALEVLPAGQTLLSCPQDLICADAGGGAMALSWSPGVNVSVSGYDIFRNGEKIATLPGNATTYEDDPVCKRILEYEVVPVSTEPNLCPGLRMHCAVINPAPECPFEPPVRLNMGGASTYDSRGKFWIGDGGGDPLDIRPDDASGTNEIGDFPGGNFRPESLTKMGFNGLHPGDRHIFSSIRWDLGGDGIDFYMEFPLENGKYTVNLYFDEGCCINRRFKIELQGAIVQDEVSYLDYDPSPALGKGGVLSFEADVDAGILRLGLLPCPECLAGADTNAIISAIEILGETVARPEPPVNLAAAPGDGTISLSWQAPVGPPVDGYNVYRTKPTPRAKINPVPIPATQITVANLQNGTEACFVVRSVDAGGTDSRDSEQKCATPGLAQKVFRRGDVDDSGAVDISDPINELHSLFLGDFDIPCQDAADFDDSGEVDISDAINSLLWQFGGGPIAPLPGPFVCGPDPTPDKDPVTGEFTAELGCDSFKMCP
ncbi:MAG: hypothetical protein HY717_13915 [Planctomycetes bacterium]|nr:hypothetical protein [Planctomycetota bacterium]